MKEMISKDDVIALLSQPITMSMGCLSREECEARNRQRAIDLRLLESIPATPVAHEIVPGSDCKHWWKSQRCQAYGQCELTAQGTKGSFWCADGARAEDVALRSGCYTCKWCGTGEEIDDYGHCWKYNGEADPPNHKVDKTVGCDEWEARAKRYRIVPAATEIEEIEADSPESALIQFATNMDTDMSAYFKAVEMPCTKE